MLRRATQRVHVPNGRVAGRLAGGKRWPISGVEACLTSARVVSCANLSDTGA